MTRFGKLLAIIFAAILAIGGMSAFKNWTTTKHHSEDNFPIDEASSIWVVVNKGRQLPSDYVPKDLVVPDTALADPAMAENMHLRAIAADSLKQLFRGASSDGYELMLVSGYRSYDTQVSVYNGYTKTIGQEEADRSSARPGFSEHQTGLAADVDSVDRGCLLMQCFGDKPAGKWLVANAYKYGFIVRYPKGKSNLTGYEYEPWHLRYIGKSLAQKLNQSGQTMEQYFSLKIYTDYPTQPLKLKS